MRSATSANQSGWAVSKHLWLQAQEDGYGGSLGE